MFNCKHCKDETSLTTCSICDKRLTKECLTCHNELAHGIIRNENIHICGSPSSKLDTPDYDEDAFKKNRENKN
jgi:hypothetical protein